MKLILVRFFYRFLLALSVVWIISACDGRTTVTSGAAEDGDVRLPEALRRASTTVKDNLSASLQVNDNTPVPMTISNDMASVTVEKPSGTATYTLTFQYQADSSSDAVPLLTATRESSASNVNFLESDYVFVHSDEDLYTNLREIESGFDPFDSESRPGNDNFEDNNSQETAYQLDAYKGVDFLERGELFDNGTTQRAFNYAGTGYLEPDGSSTGDKDYYSIEMNANSGDRYYITIDYFDPNQPGDADWTLAPLREKTSQGRFGVMYPTNSSNETAQFTMVTDEQSCPTIVESDYQLTLIRCTIFVNNTFANASGSGTVFPFLEFADIDQVASDGWLDYVISWTSVSE